MKWLMFGLVTACSTAPANPDSGALDSGVVEEDTSGPALPPKTFNTLIVSSGAFTRADGSGDSTNLFFHNIIADPGQRCHTQTIGSCLALDCTPGDGGTVTGVGAGAVTLNVNGTKQLETLPGANGIYPFKFTASLAWKAKDSVVLSAAGDANGIPMFSRTLTGPDKATLTAPIADSSNMMQIDRSADLAVTWTPLAGGVTFAISQVPKSATDISTSRRIVCELDGSKGSATIPKAALAVLQPSVSSTSDVLNFGGNATADDLPGGYKIHFHTMNATSWLANIQ